MNEPCEILERCSQICPPSNSARPEDDIYYTTQAPFWAIESFFASHADDESRGCGPHNFIRSATRLSVSQSPTYLSDTPLGFILFTEQVRMWTPKTPAEETQPHTPREVASRSEMQNLSPFSLVRLVFVVRRTR